MTINKIPILFRIVISIIGCITALLFPIILYYVCGENINKSLSFYVVDPIGAQIFNYSLIIISISLMIRKAYLLPSILILLIVYYDAINYATIHYIIAALFFLLFTIVLFLDKRYVYSIIMILNIITLLCFGLYTFEIIAILVIVIYNIEITIKVIQKEYLLIK